MLCRETNGQDNSMALQMTFAEEHAQDDNSAMLYGCIAAGAALGAYLVANIGLMMYALSCTM